jgi:hypothetical protein
MANVAGKTEKYIIAEVKENVLRMHERACFERFEVV